MDNARTSTLRERAESVMPRPRADITKMSLDEVRALVHELEVHEVELQLQNEDLQKARLEIGEMRDRYADMFEYAPIGYLTLGRDGRVIDANRTAAGMLHQDQRRLIGAKLEDHVAQPFRRLVQLNLNHAQTSVSQQTCEITLDGTDHAPLYVRIETAPIAGTDDICGFRITMNDITELKTTELELRRITGKLEQLVSERTRELQLIRDIAFMANEAGSVESAMRFCLWRVSRHSGWSLGLAYLGSDEDPDILQPVISCHSNASKRVEQLRQSILHQPLRRGHGLAGRVYDTAHPEWTTEISEDLSAHRANGLDLLEIRTAAAFPVLSGSRVVGVLNFYSEKLIEPSERILESMASIGAQLGRVVERSRMEREIVLATTAEQRRLAQELHDSVGQSLAGAAMLANTLSYRLRNASPAEAELAGKVMEHLDTAKASFRTVIRNIAVEGLDGSSLAGSLDALARRTTEWYGLQCELHDELTGSDVDWLDEMTTTQLFHIAREAIHNMVKHAQAKRAWLKLEKIEDRICLTIGDDGVGIPQGEALPGIGLRAMQRRASVIGADLTVESNQGKGTVIRCKVAIDEGE